MEGALDRPSLAAKIRVWSDFERRIALERVVEQLPEALLVALLDGLVHLEDHRTDCDPRSLNARIEAHIEATRRGEYRGKFDLGNSYGHREPWQTSAWLAATAHLFDLLLRRAETEADALDGLHALTALVEEVDRGSDELVEFEETPARFHLGNEMERAARLIASGTGTR